MKLHNNHHLHYAIYEYLSIFYFKGYEVVGGFLGSLRPMSDGLPMDRALYDDLLDVVRGRDVCQD